MLGGREAEAKVVVAVVGVVVVPIARRTVPGVVVPAATPVHAVRVAGLTFRRTPLLSQVLQFLFPPCL